MILMNFRDYHDKERIQRAYHMLKKTTERYF